MSSCRSLAAARGAFTPLLCILATSALLTGDAVAAPHEGDLFPLRQPDGTIIEVRVWGDEFYQRIESLDGYTLVRDPDSGMITYAELAPGGDALGSTGVSAAAPPPPDLAPGLRVTAAARRAQARAARERLFVEETVIRADKDRNPERSTLGPVAGITLLIDFADVAGTIPAAEFDAYLNLDGYTGFGNNGSVRDYFWDVSDGRLTYTNFVSTSYYRARNPFAYYDDPDAPYGERARELVREALNDLNNSGFDFGDYDANDDGYIDAINVFYAGFPQHGWAVGMWPHSGALTWSADGVETYRYQVTNIGTALRLATFCHENGHMICFWPDLYDYDGDSAGVGTFCLMCSTGSGTNPIEPCAPLRDLAQWCDTTDLAGLQSGIAVTHAVNDVFKVSHPSNPNEYYMIENRQSAGRDAAIPDAGIAIWHVDLLGDNSDEDQTPNQHYFCTLVQADGRWDLENNINGGDATDLWSAPGFTEFDPTTSPPATWWLGDDAPIYIDGISTSGPVMTFNYREGLGTMVVLVDAEPDVLAAPWRLTGPNGYELEGAGDDIVLVWDEGLYALTWLDVPGWSEPEPLSESGMVTADGGELIFAGTYTDPPFAAAATGLLGTGGAGVCLVDVDEDADLDVYLCDPAGANRLLRNDGDFAFVDIAAGPLADAGPSVAAVWADYDNDGDRDVYLARDGAANQLLWQEPAGTFTDIAELGLENDGAGRAAAWCDIDNDGRLDLYLVNGGGANALFRNYGDVGMGHWTLLPQAVAVLEHAGNGYAASWCDYDANGFSDVYLVNGGPNALVRNWNGTSFDIVSEMQDGGQGRSAVWGDIDADGDFDLYLANALGEDKLFANTNGDFQQLYDPALVHDGLAVGAVLADLDNDGHLDLYVARQGEDRLYFGSGAGALVPSVAGVAASASACRSVACGDLDGDGGLDLVLILDGQPNVVLENTIADRGHWLHLDLVGTTANRDAIGTIVRVVTAGYSQIRQVTAGGGSSAQDPRRVAFGLGAATRADSVIVRWPGGEAQIMTDVAGDRRLTVVQGVVTATPETAPPAVTSLLPPWPNPFNPSTTIAFELARGGPVEVAIFALDGRRVATPLRAERPAGRHEVTWQGRDDAGRRLASGAYLLRLETRAGAWTRRLTLVK